MLTALQKTIALSHVLRKDMRFAVWPRSSAKLHIQRAEKVSTMLQA